MSEVNTARQGKSQPEGHSVVAGGALSSKDSRRPLTDVAGRPLLPQVVNGLRAGLTVPPPSSVVNQRTLKPLEAGAVTDLFDPAWVPTALQRGWEIRGEQLGRLLRRIARPVGAMLYVWVQRARARRDLRGVLELYGSLGGPTPWSDLGGSRNEMIAEMRKPFWRA